MVAPTYKHLFIFLAQHILDFMKDYLPEDIERFEVERKKCPNITESRVHHRRLGFTFSFACEQYSLCRGSLTKWTEGFDIPDAVGKDPCALLQNELDILAVPVLVTALVNDTVGTLMSRSYTSPEHGTTLLGAIFGTGTNGAYVERLSNVRKLHQYPEFADSQADDNMVVNTEWGGFDDELSVLPTTPYDAALDFASVNPGDQMFEKRISGMYLGEILRRATVALMESKSFDMHVLSTSLLWQQWSLDTSFLSVIAADTGENLSIVQAEVKRVSGATHVSLSDCEAVKKIAEAIALRAARLSSVAIAAIIIQSGRLTCDDAQIVGLTPSIPDLSIVPARPSQTTTVRPSASFEASWYQGFESVKTVISQGASWIRRLTSFGLGFVDPNKSDCGDYVSACASVERDVVPADDGVIDIGVDGSLIELYPGFESMTRSALKEIKEIGVAGERRIRIGLAKDGSGVGAALIARAAEQQEIQRAKHI